MFYITLEKLYMKALILFKAIVLPISNKSFPRKIGEIVFAVFP